VKLRTPSNVIRENEAPRELFEIKIINPGELESETIKHDENSSEMMGAAFIFARSHLVDVHSL
jgi:hypothetical protein